MIVITNFQVRDNNNNKYHSLSYPDNLLYRSNYLNIDFTLDGTIFFPPYTLRVFNDYIFRCTHGGKLLEWRRRGKGGEEKDQNSTHDSVLLLNTS